MDMILFVVLWFIAGFVGWFVALYATILECRHGGSKFYMDTPEMFIVALGLVLGGFITLIVASVAVIWMWGVIAISRRRREYKPSLGHRFSVKINKIIKGR